MAQEYNQRKKRKGAYWEVRYHATAVETGEHLEIQSPRRKCVLINHEKLANLAGYDFYDSFRESHKKWVNESLSNGSNVRDRQWTRGVAVGEKQFVEKIKTELGSKALGRQIREASGGYELRERMVSYMTDFDSKKVNIGLENTYIWRVFP